MGYRVLPCALAAVFVAATGPSGRADDTNEAGKVKKEVHSIYNVDAIIKQASANVSARYNLNKEQREITERMFEEGVNRFLTEHAEEIYPLIRDLTQADFLGRKLTESQRKRVGTGGAPLIELAKKAILDYNKEWRSILSEEQKRLHDWDLSEMEGQFVQIHLTQVPGQNGRYLRWVIESYLAR